MGPPSQRVSGSGPSCKDIGMAKALKQQRENNGKFMPHAREKGWADGLGRARLGTERRHQGRRDCCSP